MKIAPLEILALILIVLALIKIAFLLVNPQSWYKIVQLMYKKPFAVSVISAALSGIVLVILIKEGVTIVEILAVSLFISLLMVAGLANYADQIVGWAKEQDVLFIFKRLWVYSIVWLLLIAWGIGELFFDF